MSIPQSSGSVPGRPVVVRRTSVGRGCGHRLHRGPGGGGRGAAVQFGAGCEARPTLVVPITDSLALNYAMTAFVLALVATGAAHLLSVTTPRPRVFFGWLVGLGTVAAMVMPFASEGSLAGKISTALINLAVGIAIGTLLSAVLSRTVTDPERSWQQR